MTQLAELLLEGRDSIVAAWRERVRHRRPARSLPDRTLDRHVPGILERVADALRGRAIEPDCDSEPTRAHVVERLSLGFDLEDVVHEYTVLRACILDRWVRDRRAPDEALPRISAAIDALVAATVACYAERRARSLATLDRIAEEAVGGSRPEAFLRQLLRSVTESPRHVSAAALLIGDPAVDVEPAALYGIDRARARALAVLAAGWRAASPDGAMREPPPAMPDDLAPLDLRSLWWRPLARRERTLGVALVASRTRDAFSREDRLLFDAMASRAVFVVAHARAVEAERDGQRNLVAAVDRERTACGVAELWVATLGAVLGSIPDAVFVGDGHGVRAVNRAALELTGVASEDELVGPIDVALGRLDPRSPAAGRPVPADELPFARALRGERCVTELVLGVPARCPSRAVVVRASAAPVEISGEAIGAVMVLTDVTARKRATDHEAFLSAASATLGDSLESEATLAAVARLAVPSFADVAAVNLVGPRGEIRPVAVAGADPEVEAAARDALERHPLDPSAAYGVARVLRTGETLWSPEPPDASRVPEIDLEFARLLGVRSYVLVPLIARGRTLGALAFVTTGDRRFDEGDVALAEELGRRAGVAVDNARLYGEAQEAVRLRDRVLAVVSHDLRNPLWAVKLGVALLRSTPCAGDPAAEKQLGMLVKSTARMERMIRDLLDMANIQAGKLSVKRALVEADALVADAAEHHGPLVAQAGRRLVVERRGDGVRVDCDRERILQVIDNLVGNAVKFTPPGGAITLAVASDAHEVAFSVSDTGAGIPKADQPHVFDAYWKGRAASEQAGTGLGLYICRGIVEAHGGTIEVASEEGRGTTFTFRLPIADLGAAPEEPVSRPG